MSDINETGLLRKASEPPTFAPTMRLRWRFEHGGAYNQSRSPLPYWTLQQLWLGSDGTERWQDIEVAE